MLGPADEADENDGIGMINMAELGHASARSASATAVETQTPLVGIFPTFYLRGRHQPEPGHSRVGKSLLVL